LKAASRDFFRKNRAGVLAQKGVLPKESGNGEVAQWEKLIALFLTPKMPFWQIVSKKNAYPNS
jgi:hypothetical protein